MVAPACLYRPACYSGFGRQLIAALTGVSGSVASRTLQADIFPTGRSRPAPLAHRIVDVEGGSRALAPVDRAFWSRTSAPGGGAVIGMPAARRGDCAEQGFDDQAGCSGSRPDGRPHRRCFARCQAAERLPEPCRSVAVLDVIGRSWMSRRPPSIQFRPLARYAQDHEVMKSADFIDTSVCSG